MIVGISGRIGSGKDTIGNMIIENMGYYAVRDDMGAGERWYWHIGPWEIKKFAGKLKKIASMMTGIPVEKFEDQDFKNSFLGHEWNDCRDSMSVREFLQKLGTEAIRDGLHKNAWVNATFADYEKGDNWIITDVRFPNEAQAIKDRGGVVIRVNRMKTADLIDGPGGTQLHPSETSLDDWEFDYHISNDGSFAELSRKVVDLLADEIVQKMKETVVENRSFEEACQLRDLQKKLRK